MHESVKLCHKQYIHLAWKIWGKIYKQVACRYARGGYKRERESQRIQKLVHVGSQGVYITNLLYVARTVSKIS